MKNAPAPENVTQLRAFLRMLCYSTRTSPQASKTGHKVVLEDRAAAGLRKIQETPLVCESISAFPTRSGTNQLPKFFMV